MKSGREKEIKNEEIEHFKYGDQKQEKDRKKITMKRTRFPSMAASTSETEVNSMKANPL